MSAALCVVVAVILACPPARWVVGVRLGDRLRLPRVSPRRVGGAVWAIGLVAWIVFAPAISFALVGVAVLLVAACGRRLHVRAEQRRRTASCRDDVSLALDLFAAQLRAGIGPSAAWSGVVDEVPLPAVSDRGVDGFVPALRDLARRPGTEALGDLAAAWWVAERSGAPLAETVDRLAARIRDERELGREVAAEAAPARATGRLMAVLPLFGLGLGSGLGVDPVDVLLSTVPGAACLVVGVALASAGVLWVDRIVDAVESGR